MKKTLLVCGSACVLLAVLLSLRSRGQAVTAGAAFPAPTAAEVSSSVKLQEAHGGHDSRMLISEEASEAPVAVADPAEKRGIVDLLSDLADAEEAAVKEAFGRGLAGNVQDSRVERAVVPILEDPGHVQEVIGLLESGELHNSTQPGDQAKWSLFGDLSRLEYAGCRALYWAMVGYNDPGDGTNPFLNTANGRQAVLNVVAALARLDGAVQEYLLGCVGAARYQATSLPVFDKTYWQELLQLRPAFVDDEDVFWRLLSILKQSMTPEELRMLDAVAADPENPVAVREQLGALFQSGAHDLALMVARQMFTTASYEVKKAITGAVISGADPLDAAEFLVSAEHVADTKNWPATWIGFGDRDGASEALDATYSALFTGASGPSDPYLHERARVLSVMGMRQTSAARLLEIFHQEASPSVRGQALVTMSSGDDYRPQAEHLDLIERGLADGTISELGCVSATYNMAAKASKESALRIRGIELLKRIRDSSSSDSIISQATESMAKLSK